MVVCTHKPKLWTVLMPTKIEGRVRHGTMNFVAISYVLGDILTSVFKGNYTLLP